MSRARLLIRGDVRPRPAFVATTGGHLVEMRLLARTLEPARYTDALWITHRTAQSESVLAGEDVLFVDFIHARDIAAVLRATPDLVRALRVNRVDTVYSAGAAIALAALPLSRLAGAPATFVESLTRPQAPSLTGSILSMLPWVKVFTQHESRAGLRWRHYPGLLGSFTAQQSALGTPPRRILVTCGTAGRHGFRRLLERLTEILPDDCDVIWQTGSTAVDGLAIDARPMMSDPDFQRAIAEADVVVSHAGCGTLLSCLVAGKTPVLVPRRARYGEHVDDHQQELALLAERRRLAVVSEADEVTWTDLCDAARNVVSWQAASSH